MRAPFFWSHAQPLAAFAPACGLFTSARVAKLLPLDPADMAIQCTGCGSFDVEGVDGCAGIVNRALAEGLNPVVST